MPEHGELAGNGVGRLALGGWQVPDGPECETAVRWALELGYRHIDTATFYGNEHEVGRAVADSGLARETIFVTTKLVNPAGEAVRNEDEKEEVVEMIAPPDLGRPLELPLMSK